VTGRWAAGVKFVPVPIVAAGDGLPTAWLVSVAAGQVSGGGLLAVLAGRIPRVTRLRAVIPVMPATPGPVDRRSGLVGTHVASGHAGLGFPRLAAPLRLPSGGLLPRAAGVPVGTAL